MVYSPSERQLRTALRATALVHGALYALGWGLALFGPRSAFFLEPPFVSNAVAGVGLLGLLAWLAGADVRRFAYLAQVLTFGFAWGALACAAALLSPLGPSQSGWLGAAFIWCALFGAITAGSLRRARLEAPEWTPWRPTSETPTAWEGLGRVVCVLLGLGAVVVALAHLVLPFWSGALPAFFRTPLMVAGSALKLGLLGAVLLAAAGDLRRRAELVTLFAVGNAASLAVVLSLLVFNRFGGLEYPGLGASGPGIMLGALLVDISAVGAFWWLRIRLEASLLERLPFEADPGGQDAGGERLPERLGFFGPFHFRALEAICDTLIDGPKVEGVAPHGIVRRTDAYLSAFPSKRLGLAKLSVMGLELLPTLVGLPPLSWLRPAERRDFMDRHFKRQIVDGQGLYPLLDRVRFTDVSITNLIEAMMRFNMQLSFIGYYSDPRVQQSIGYARFAEREEGKNVSPRGPTGLAVTTPDRLRAREEITADVVIIGSGAAGATLAEQVLQQSGRSVLLLEKGPHIEPKDMSEDEVKMISGLYADGALQIAQSLRFTVLQGSCVGGTTVVNNAVCFDTPDDVLERWNTEFRAGIDVGAYRAAQAEVRSRMRIRSIEASSSARPWQHVLNPGDRVIGNGIEVYRDRHDRDALEFEVVEANINDCLGCGHCNIGCRYGRKLSMLDTVLPEAQRDHVGRLEILAGAEVVRLERTGARVHTIRVNLRDGDRVRELAIKPEAVIVSAGTIASSWALLRSGIGEGELPIGRGLGFNMGSPLHGLWDEPLHSYAGLQIAHYIKAKNHPGFVCETWYNPPVAQALTMPGWLDTHHQNMRHYDRMAAIGVLVGTEPSTETGYLRPALFLRGQPDIHYRPGERDLEQLIEALAIAGEIMFGGGATRVFASTRHYRSFQADLGVLRPEDNLRRRLEELIRSEDDILLGTGHPQGGNRLSEERGRDGFRGGVIDPDFKVYGFENLFVCDASVFPSATRVNPQLSVMTMARYAAPRILAQLKEA